MWSIRVVLASSPWRLMRVVLSLPLRGECYARPYRLFVVIVWPACLRGAQSLLASVLKAWRAEACLKARGAHVWLRRASPLVGLAMLDRLI